MTKKMRCHVSQPGKKGLQNCVLGQFPNNSCTEWAKCSIDNTVPWSGQDSSPSVEKRKNTEKHGLSIMWLTNIADVGNLYFQILKLTPPSHIGKCRSKYHHEGTNNCFASAINRPPDLEIPIRFFPCIPGSFHDVHMSCVFCTGQFHGVGNINP